MLRASNLLLSGTYMFRGYALEELKPLKKGPFKDLLMYCCPQI